MGKDEGRLAVYQASYDASMDRVDSEVFEQFPCLQIEVEGHEGML
jgi:hypothetical protein